MQRNAVCPLVLCVAVSVLRPSAANSQCQFEWKPTDGLPPLHESLLWSQVDGSVLSVGGSVSVR